MDKILGRTSTLRNILTLNLGRYVLVGNGESIVLKKFLRRQRYDVFDIIGVRSHRNYLSQILVIDSASGSIKVKGLGKKSDERLRQFLSEQVLKTLRRHHEIIELRWRMGEEFLNSDGYISTSKKDEFAQVWRQTFSADSFGLLQKIYRNTFLDRSSEEVDSAFKKLNIILQIQFGLDECIQKRNADFVAQELKAYSKTFDTVEKLPLTQEQRLSAVYFEDVNLLVASAGSGKTSSLVGKAIYALKKKYFEPREILMLAFAKEAASGLSQRFAEALDRQNQKYVLPEIKTFHSLGMGIIQAVEQAKPVIGAWAADDELSKRLLTDLMEEVCQDAFLNAEMTLIISTMMFGNATSFEQRSYFQGLFKDRSLDAMDMKAEIQDENPSLKTLKGDRVRSIEELVISNWLYLHGINYEYERAATYVGADGATKEHRPDFYYPDVHVYHEHFALNKDGTVPHFLGPDYLPRVQFKRELFQETKEKFFETHSSMFKDDSVFKVLKDSLRGFGLNPEPRKLDSLSEEFTEAHSSLMSLIGSILKHIRNQGRSSETLNVVPFDPLSRSFNNLVTGVLRKYEELLADKRVLDFEEMLIKASRYVENGRYQSPYKFICIDEFQDMSQGRRRLVKALLDQKKGTSLFAVGDDWQGIYRFAGADLDIFTRAAEYFGPTQEIFLTNTFRSNQGIADVASCFVQKNPVQKKKTVRSHDDTRAGVLKILSYEKEFDALLVVEDELKNLVQDLRGKGKTATVFILARYNFLQPHRLKIREWENASDKTLTISTMSFHSSKGMEADYVFILGMNSGPMGFPSVKNDHPFMQMYMSKADTYPYAEERRLFYVALTRAKKKVFFVTRRGIPSVFLTEIWDQDGAGEFFGE